MGGGGQVEPDAKAMSGAGNEGEGKDGGDAKAKATANASIPMDTGGAVRHASSEPGGLTGLDDYEVIKPIGKGKFAVVYRARRKADDAIVALKKISVDAMDAKVSPRRRAAARALSAIASPVAPDPHPPSPSPSPPNEPRPSHDGPPHPCDPKARNKCLKEVRLLQSLRHPNVIEYLDSFIEGNEVRVAPSPIVHRPLRHLLLELEQRACLPSPPPASPPHAPSRALARPHAPSRAHPRRSSSSSSSSGRPLGT